MIKSLLSEDWFHVRVTGSLGREEKIGYIKVNIQNSGYCIKINDTDHVWICCCLGSSCGYYILIVHITVSACGLSKGMKK